VTSIGGVAFAIFNKLPEHTRSPIRFSERIMVGKLNKITPYFTYYNSLIHPYLTQSSARDVLHAQTYSLSLNSKIKLLSK